MTRIADRLFSGAQDDCAALGVAICHAAKNPCHTKKCGKVKAGQPDYLYHREGEHLWLNMIDSPSPNYYPLALFEAFLAWFRERYAAGQSILILCNKGESRSPSLALLACAKVLGLCSNVSYDAAWDDFAAMALPGYAPTAGIETWLREHWAEMPLALLTEPKPPQPRSPSATDDSALAEQWKNLTPDVQMQMARTHPLVHFATFVEIEYDDKTWQTPTPNVLQRRMAEAYDWCIEHNQRCRLIVLKSRKTGASTFSAELCHHHMHRFKSNMMLMGDNDERVKDVFRMFCGFPAHDKLPREAVWVNDTEKGHLTYPDKNKGFVQLGSAGAAKVGIGGTRNIVWMTESARYAKTGQRTDKDVIMALLNSVSRDSTRVLIIAESTAEGACYDAETEILTSDGWKFFKNLTGHESILTKNRETDVAYYEPRWSKVEQHWRGPMVKIDTRTVNLNVTPNHMIWMARQRARMRLEPASSMVRGVTDYIFDRAMTWERPGLTHWTIPSHRYGLGAGFGESEEKHIPINIWLRWFGHWLSDGHVTPVNRSVATTQTKFPALFRDSFTAFARCMGSNLREKNHERGKRYIISSAQLCNYLKHYAQPKRIPRKMLMEMSREQCRYLLDAIYEGDGDREHRNRDTDCDYGKIYAGVDKEFQDDLQELSLKAGYASSIYGPERNRVTTFTESTRAMVRHSNPPKLVEGHDGPVYCVSLPQDHLLMVRRGGVAVWCGNSGFHFETWNGASNLEERQRGRLGNTWIKIFAAWHEFAEHRLPRNGQTEEFFGKELDERERRGVKLYKWTWNQIAWRRQKIKMDCSGDEKAFDQDYPESDTVAFVSSGRPRFNIDGVTRLEVMARDQHDKAERGILERREDTVGFLPRKDEETWLWVDERPKFGLKYLCVVDPCKGEQQAGAPDPDAHAAGVLRDGYFDAKMMWHPPRLVACIDVQNGCHWEDDMLGERAAMLAKWYGNCLVIPETEGGGVGVIKVLREHGATIWHRQKEDSATPGKRIDVVGFETNKGTRPSIVSALADAIRLQDQGLDVCYQPAVAQLKTFVTNDRGKAAAAAGAHDDFVMMLAIGVYHLPFATVYAPPRSSPLAKAEGPILSNGVALGAALS